MQLLNQAKVKSLYWAYDECLVTTMHGRIISFIWWRKLILLHLKHRMWTILWILHCIFVRFICITFAGLSIWATIYEYSLEKSREIDNEIVSPSRQAIHPIHITKTTKSNGQRIYTYENNTIDMENSEPAYKMDKIHANNIINGCTFELHPISIEHNNGNHLANNNRTALYRLNNNNANNINNNHHAGNNDDAIDNNHLKRTQHSRNGSTYDANQFDKHDANHLSKQNIEIRTMKTLPHLSIVCVTFEIRKTLKMAN